MTSSRLSVDVVDLTGDRPADRAAAEQWYSAVRASWDEAYGERADQATLHELQCRACGDRSHRCLHLLAREAGGAAVGAAAIRFPLRDNTFQAFAEIEVHPDRRRRAVGTALLAETTSRVLADGRTTLTVEAGRALDRDDVAGPFAARHGFTRALANDRNDLDLPLRAAPGTTAGGDRIVDLDAVLAPLDAEVAAADPGADYHVITYWDTLPDRWLDHRSGLAARLSTDAPMGDLALEPEVWDGDRFTDRQQIVRAAGQRRVETLAVHTATDVLVGASDIVLNPARPEVAHQWDTIVASGHRGRRLGMWIKAVNLRALVAAHPGVRRLVTYNAASNSPMLRVNHAMGYRRVGSLVEWQKRLVE